MAVLAYPFSNTCFIQFSKVILIIALLLIRLVGQLVGFVIAIMLSLLIFVGEAVRDAFDPRKTFR